MMGSMTARTFAFDPARSGIDIHASSSVHPIHTHAPIEGWLRLDVVDGGADAASGGGTIDASSPASGEVRFDLGGMRSGNPLVDREADRRLHVKRFPTVVGELRTLDPGEEADHYEIGGDLTFHGVTRALTGTVRLGVAADGSTLELDGETTIDVTDFDVQPPSLLVVKVHKEVRVVLHAVGEAT